MPERPLRRESELVGPVLPVPVSPIWSWLDTWYADTVTVKYWDITIPDDTKVYKLCNYSQAMMPTGWIYVIIYQNGVPIYNQFSGYTISWSPGSANAPKFVHGDVIRIGIPHLYAAYPVNYYWQMDFWREPRG